MNSADFRAKLSKLWTTAVESFGPRLREELSAAENSASMADLRDDFDKIIRQREMQRFEFNLSTIDKEAPFQIIGTVDHFLAGYAMGVQVNGALHPYDLNFESGVMGDENKNPALLPALKLFREKVVAIVQTGIDNYALRPEVFGVINSKTPVFDHSANGAYLLARLLQQPEERQVLQLFKDVREGIEEILPELQKTIDNNQHLQPNIKDKTALLMHGVSLSAFRDNAAARSDGLIAKVVEGKEAAKQYLGDAWNAGHPEARTVARSEAGDLETIKLGVRLRPPTP